VSAPTKLAAPFRNVGSAPLGRQAAKLTWRKEKMIFELEPEVIIERYGHSKILLHNTRTGKKIPLTNKTHIAIISKIDPDWEDSVEELASKLKIPKWRIKCLFKKLTRKGFMYYPEKEKRNGKGNATVTDTTLNKGSQQ
jgi:hypothetical protein